MRVLFCGGGTAGHVTPAIAIAEQIAKKYKSSAVAFVGRRGGSENKLITDSGFKLYEIDIKGFTRKLSIDNLSTLRLYFMAKKEALEIIKEFEPDAVIGTGGYVCAPVIAAAAKRGIFTAIHESNAALGLTARMLAGRCDKLLLGMNIKTRFGNAEFVGNPVSDRFGSLSKKRARQMLGIPADKRLILSVGGSIGAKKLNEAVALMMRSYILENADIYHIHSSGKRYYGELQESYPELCGSDGRARVLPFIDRMPLYLSAADLLICRCGAMTLAVAARSGCPMVMIPSPNVTADHQRKNAEVYERVGAGITFDEEGLCAETLGACVDALLHDRESLENMRRSAEKLFTDDPKDKIIKLIELGTT